MVIGRPHRAQAKFGLDHAVLRTPRRADCAAHHNSGEAPAKSDGALSKPTLGPCPGATRHSGVFQLRMIPDTVAKITATAVTTMIS